jgi:hypothetical protein
MNPAQVSTPAGCTGHASSRVCAGLVAALAFWPAGAGAIYSSEELCRSGFELERLARSDMKQLAREASDEGRRAEILRRVLDRWGVMGHYLKARDETAAAVAETTAGEIDAAVRAVLRRVCESAS